MGGCDTCHMDIIGHRGAMGLEPENSFSSFERAISLGCSMIEMDARSTLDGKVIIMHDDTVDRTADGRGYVSRMPLEELKKLRLRNGEEIPTLDEILERFGKRCVLNIELKDEGSVISAYESVRRMKLLEHVIFSSFHSPWLVKLKLENPEVRTAFISDDRDLDLVKIAIAAEAEGIHPSARITNLKLVEKAHDSGLKINVWTVNRPWQMKKIMKLGADGIFTDRPDILAEQLKRLGGAGKT